MKSQINLKKCISRITPKLSRLNFPGIQIIEIMNMLNPRKAAGHDGTTTNELMVLADDMVDSLANICRQR